jgi:hypothetical protein
MYGICKLTLIPLRAEPAHRSEMVSQLLFGESYKVLDNDSAAGWIKIESLQDNYQGWIEKFQHTPLTDSQFEEITANSNFICVMPFADASEEEGFTAPIVFVMGSLLPVYEDRIYAKYFKIDNIFRINLPFAQTVVKDKNEKTSFEDLKRFAFQYLNTPYLWGGRTRFGIDCSGFTQQVYTICGYPLRRDSKQQAEQGIPVNFENRKPGDLAFFQNLEGKIMHVGILLENDEIIHASSKVRIDKFDQNGIFAYDRQAYSHTFHSIRRVIES